MFDEPAKRLRWPRSQRFLLSDAGREAATTYRSSIVTSRATEGRASYDAARLEWARTRSIEPDDGLYLLELENDARSVSEIVDALETCGKTRQDALTTLERLFDAGLVVIAPGK